MTTEATPTTQPTYKPRIRRIGAYRYVVESRSQPGLGRQVDTLRLRCSCPAGQHGRRCHHLIKALELEAWRARQQEQAKAANWTSAPAASQAQAKQPAPVPVPVPAAAARPVERGMRALEAAFE